MDEDSFPSAGGMMLQGYPQRPARAVGKLRHTRGARGSRRG